ncbi:MAG: aromatic ring-hydroxylating dioxygenase subunit alpha [Burkholderiales bacterium]|mgnify:CR=1 FL=1|jgi:vanillate O-demethylase monooxygenase subunit|nr:aromatic ring-hydroxylating dioxygenase subunit alpha [Burkholderiales bacterium]MBP6250192.1 aromatic ring-hydroxylating dioxygenase subunit alpha [Leptothrix sp. (in: b-proteobacteria)]MBP7519350.1 aromatic ring-hydroxylating dioxygenase subunit alpha [Leptothrix sp. (in: b-proteobacteria)]HQY07726.1 aromatic ring-hydroxylating dioxygenase subunit alpha [Burkholderiaceae bacterium]
MFPKNTWYVACTPDDMADKPLGRQICGERMVFYRNADGQASALEDFCPHRGAPLSLGRVCKGQLVCGYHGLEMGCDGRTRSMPGQKVERFAAIRAYPTVERHGFIWVWPGDAAQADVALLPEFEWSGSPEWAYGGGLYHIACDYRLMIDNLMDLTHETYVHATSIGQPEIDETPCETRRDGDQVILERHMEGIGAPPFWQMAMRMNGMDPTQKVDRWQICRFSPPSHVMIDVGVAVAGHGGFDAPLEFKTSATVVDFITPETEQTMWYFWGLARRFKPADPELTGQIREGQGRIFSEDREMLERQQRNLQTWPQRRLMTLNIDAGGAHARRIIQRMVAAEQAPVLVS